MTDETHELLTMSPEALGVWFDKYPAGLDSTLAALRDTILTAARESDAAARIAAQREAASRAWDAADTTFDPNASRSESRDRYLDREHPLPARECVLSNGDRVTLSDCKHYLIVRNMAEPPRTWRVDQWRHIAITGADFDALKSFAAGVGR